MSNSKIITPKQWLELMKKPFVPTMMFNALAAENIMNPTGAFATSSYVAQAEATASEGTSPQSIFEGMQTIADLARVAAEFNPLDPEGNGDKAHFLQFAQYLDQAPFLDTIVSDTIRNSVDSDNSSTIINSFVDCFVGISSDDRWEITQAVTELVEISLSYAGATQQYSNFTQNLLQPYDNGVEFHLYCSQFQVFTTEDKGDITYHSQYEVLREVYRLSEESWENIRPELEEEVTTGTDDWLNSMTTPPKEGSTVRTPCLKAMKKGA